MRYRFGICLLFVISISLKAQTIDLKGCIKNSSGTPIQEAVVRLVGMDIADTTGSDGSYNLQKVDETALAVYEIPHSEAISIQRGIVRLAIPQAAPMSIEVFDVKGNVLDRIHRLKTSAGIYHFDLLRKERSSQMLVVRASIGPRVSTFRYLPLQQKLQLVHQKNLSVSPDNKALSKQLANIDSIEVSADGYDTKVVMITSYQEENDIILEEALEMDPFSFFVTSYESLAELAGSSDGFGGDLRFGETGPGAGLRGADKICETIAEMSMSGSSAKQWRAFLSVTDSGNGNQVDARDRIGNGPWYDRTGRLLAPTLDDLLNERPQNGDEAIKNDLPNEFGIPNHRPDPTAANADNHHMITGSDDEGKLYNGLQYTCQDWTSVSANDKARFGLAWPRNYGKIAQGGGSSSHWFSSGNTPGCEAGTDLDGASRGGVAGVYTIGNGGGYGGFYCFALKP